MTAPDLAPPVRRDRVRLIDCGPAPTGLRGNVRYLARRWWREFAGFVAVAFVALFTVLGAVFAFGDHRPPAAPTIPPAPDPAAEGYALRVARLLLSYDPAKRDDRLREVAALVPGAPSNLGWDGTGVSVVSDAWVTGDLPTLQGRLVTVAVVANGTVRTVAVTVLTVDGQVRLVGVPAVFAGPAVAPADPAPGAGANGPEDRAAADLARPTIEGFLRAWGTGDPAAATYAAEGWTPPAAPRLKLMSVAFRMPAATPGTPVRQVAVRVRWADQSGAAFPAAYQLAVTTTGTRWAVQSITPTTAVSFSDLPA